MCDPVVAPWLIGGAIVAGTATSLSAGADARRAAGDQQAYLNKVDALNRAFRLETMDYQNQEWAKDIVHYDQLIDFQTGEFDKFKDYATQQSSNIKENYVTQMGTTLLRSVQEDIAATLQVDTTNSHVRSETGTLRARGADSGVAGNSVALVEGEVQRQGGEARRAIARNLEGRKQQLRLEQFGIRANAATAFASIQIPAFAPIEPPRPPAPVSPVSPSAPVSRPSSTSVLLGGIAGGLNMGASMGSIYNSFRIP